MLLDLANSSTMVVFFFGWSILHYHARERQRNNIDEKVKEGEMKV
jgi:hypothetical protein